DADVKLQQHEKDEGPGVTTLKAGAEAGNLHLLVGRRPVSGEHMRTIMEQDLFGRAALFAGERKAIVSAVLPIRPAQRPFRVMLQGLIPAGKCGVFVPSQHPTHECENASDTFRLPDFLHLLPQPESAPQVETKTEHLAIEEVPEVPDFGSVPL